MTTDAREIHGRMVDRLVREYADRGYRVAVDPDSSAIPFDLDGYRPDLLAENDAEHLIIEVKHTGTRLPVDRFTRIVQEVSRHTGWRFLLVTADDVAADDGMPQPGASLLSWEELRRRTDAALKLSSTSPGPVALLSLSAALEGILRRHAEQVALPVERLPTAVLLKHLYSHGELSMKQYDAAVAAMEVRNRVAHGFDAPNVSAAVSQFESLALDLLREWSPDRRVA